MSAKPAVVVRCTRGWVAFYTRNLPPEIGQRRRTEIESDLWEQINEAGSHDRVAAQILGRWLRGIPADVWWRYHTLLAERGVRERSRDMLHTLRSQWWPPLVLLYTLLAVTAVAVPAILGDHQQSSGAMIMTTIAVTAGASMAAGLAVRDRRLVAGSWMIAVGALPGLASMLLPLGLAVLIGGVWTGNLAFHTPPTGVAPDVVLADRRAHLLRIWWWWLMLAVGCAATGFAALLAADNLDGVGSEQQPTVLGGLLWQLWIVSWLGAAVSAAVGAVLAVMQLAVRHRTRHA